MACRLFGNQFGNLNSCPLTVKSLGTNLSGNWMKTRRFPFTKMNVNISFRKWGIFRFNTSVLINQIDNITTTKLRLTKPRAYFTGVLYVWVLVLSCGWPKEQYKQRVLMHRHQGLNVRHGLCHIYMRYLYIYELFIAFVCFVVCSLL